MTYQNHKYRQMVNTLYRECKIVESEDLGSRTEPNWQPGGKLQDPEIIEFLVSLVITYQETPYTRNNPTNRTRNDVLFKYFV